MSGKYAADSAAPVSTSRNEIERTLARFGVTAFAYFSNSAGQSAHEVLAAWMDGWDE